MYSVCFLTYFIIYIVCTLDLVPSVHSWQQWIVCNLVRLIRFGTFMAAVGRLHEHAGEFSCKLVRLVHIGLYMAVLVEFCTTSIQATENE